VYILGRPGFSLADVYEIEGSSVGVDDLQTKEVHLVHELGGQIVGERLRTFLHHFESADNLQSVAFDVADGQLNDVPCRILGLCVTTDTIARLTGVQVSLESADNAFGEFPLFVWSTGNDTETAFRYSQPGASPSTEGYLSVTDANQMQAHPTLAARGEDDLMGNLVMRGDTAAFGAGTVKIHVMALIARCERIPSAPGDPKNFGLPFPSW